MFEKLGGRKVVIGVGFFLAGTAIDLYTERGLSQNLLYLAMFLYGSFTLGNAAEKKFTGANPGEAIQDQIKGITDAMVQLEGNQNELASLVDSTHKAIKENLK